MLRLTCTKCQGELLLDEAFAGGVCRCQKCGAIQTVPGVSRTGAKVLRRPASVGNSRRGRWIVLVVALLLVLGAVGYWGHRAGWF